jgi:NitT/TauT family transport system substrate-binding protein
LATTPGLDRLHGSCFAQPDLRRRPAAQSPGERIAGPNAWSNVNTLRHEECAMKLNVRSITIALTAAVGLCGPLAATGPASAAEPMKLKMILNWKYQGPQGWFFLAQDRGYFKKAGIDLTMDQGRGSGAPIPLVASGTYDVGFGDINALIQFAAQKPAEAPIAVYVMYNQPPFTIAVRADSGIKTPKDLEGKTLGSAPGDGALKLFPAFCKVAKIDCSKIKITNFQPSLREQMLMNKQVAGVFGYVNTIRFSAKLMHVPEKDIRYIRYGDFGMDLYSNAIIVSKKLTKEHPEVVKGLIAAINHGVEDALKDPAAAVDAVAKREPLIKKDVELERFTATLHDEMNSPEIAKIGLGNVDKARLEKSIKILVDAQKLPRTPSVDEIYTDKFMPPASELPKKLF